MRQTENLPAKLLVLVAMLVVVITGCKKADEPGNTITDIDGNVYKTVVIGTQTWLTENLKTTRYRNGDEIGTTTPPTKSIAEEVTPKYQWSYNGSESNVTTYGRLYTWNVVNDSRGVCPAGWHVPSDAEWKALVNFLGGGIEADAKLKEDSSLWESPNEANNSSGFAARPGGWHESYGYFDYLGESGWWWSSTEDGSGNFAYYFTITYGYGPVEHNAAYIKNGFSIRCIKD